MCHTKVQNAPANPSSVPFTHAQAVSKPEPPAWDPNYFYTERNTTVALSQAEQERLYDLQRSGELYRKPRGLLLAVADVIDDEAAIAAWIDKERAAEDTDAIISLLEEIDGGDREPDPEAFGTLADGTPIMGVFDGVNGVYHRHSCVESTLEEWHITAGADGVFSFGTDGLDIDPITMPQLRALRELLNSGTFERMVLAAEAWGRGDAEPPAFDHTMPLAG